MAKTYREKVQEIMCVGSDISSEEDLLDETFYMKADTVICILDELESKVKDIRLFIESYQTLEAIEELKNLEKELY